MSEDNLSPILSRKRNRVVLEDSSSDESVVRSSRPGRRAAIVETDSDSSVEYPKRRRLRAVSESSDSSNSELVVRRIRTSKLESSSSDEDSSDLESDIDSKLDAEPTSSNLKKSDSDESSDSNESEKCPICLLKFKFQEVGSPESCDHSFCAECIKEWAKSVNTCPVDRKKFNAIIIRSSYEGKIVQTVGIEDSHGNDDFNNETVVNDFDSVTCELCRSTQNEDRLLLCDRCDLAFHIYCLNPPLTEVPDGEWFCDACCQVRRIIVDAMEFELVHSRITSRIATRMTRLIPRTLQSERIRTRIVHQRLRNNDGSSDGDYYPTESEPAADEVVSSTNRRVGATKRKPKSTKRVKKRTRRTQSSYKIVYQIDDVTGEKIAIKKKTRKCRKKLKKSKKNVNFQKARSTKNRLACQLGIQRPKTVGQTLPDVKVRVNPDDITVRRSRAGIQALHLFGQRDELNYFSGSDIEFEASSSVNIRIARRPNISDIAAVRRNARRKAVLLDTLPSTSTVDILGSILETQTKLHSKNSIMSVGRDGRVKIDDKKTSFPLHNDGRGIRQTPMYSNNTSGHGGNSGGYSTSNQYSSNHSYYQYENAVPSSTVGYSGNEENNYNRGDGNLEDNSVCDYSSAQMCDSNEQEKDDAKKENVSGSSDRNTPDSELDIYGDIETVSTSKFEESDMKCPPPPMISSHLLSMLDDEDNESDTDMVIDTEKPDSDKYDPATVFESDDEDKEEDAVTSTSESFNVINKPDSNYTADCDSQVQFETIQSSNQVSSALLQDEEIEEQEDDCPNSNIYSSESMNLAKTTDLNAYGPIECTDTPDECKEEDEEEKEVEIDTSASLSTSTNTLSKDQSGLLYSDSEDESFMKLNPEKPFGIGDIKSMTEDISEEERSYTPCLDEKEQAIVEGLEGLDTEMISDDDKNDFEEMPEQENDSQVQQQTLQDVDALEINAKESELDFTKPDDGEDEDTIKQKNHSFDELEGADDTIQSPPPALDDSHENDTQFKRLSKNNKIRNYRDKDKERSASIEKHLNENKKESKKRKKRRTGIALYDVRSVIEAKPKRDRFGRDPTNRKRSSSVTRSLTPSRRFEGSESRRSQSRLSRSPTPPVRVGRDETAPKSASLSSRSRTPPLRRSLSGRSKSLSPIAARPMITTRSVSKSPSRKSLPPRSRKRIATSGRDKNKRKRSKSKTRRKKPNKRSRSRSPVKYRRKPWERRRSRGWSPSLSRSGSPEYRRPSPSWTPPRNLESSSRPQNLTITLPNDSTRKRDKRKRSDRRRRDSDQPKRRRVSSRRRPAKEVFTSGNNILVSVSFNKENEERRRLRNEEPPVVRRVIRENDPGSGNKNKSPKARKPRTVTNIKPVAIIDLERSPFRIITPPNDVIVLSDSDTADNNNNANMNREATPQAASPEPEENNGYVNTTGPKTPPEPQVKFTFTSKPSQLRAITNPLMDVDEADEDIDPQQELENRLNEVMHKGPNTPPEPPNSPPSSPDAYDPFEPTKSRSPTPAPAHHSQSSITQTVDDSQEEISETKIDLTDKCQSPTHNSLRSLTPPLNSSNLQPADSQSSIKIATPEKNGISSPERSIAVVINQVVQPQTLSKIIPPTFSSLVTSTPIISNMGAPRINILNSTVIPQSAVASIPRIVLPNITKSSPVNKVSPSKTQVKLTPIKPMPTKTLVKIPVKGAVRKKKTEVALDFESPYSPGSNDYDDLFEPPLESVKPSQPSKNVGTKAPLKQQNAFDTLFGSSPVQASKNRNKKKAPKKHRGKATKLVGVKLDEDNLKILDDLPNSAVELQVKDKFLKKLNRQERVVEEVKIVLKPYYSKKKVNKEEYKEVLRRAVPKICHSKSGEINPKKIQKLVVAYVKKVKHNKKVTSSSNAVHSQNAHSQGIHPQKTEAVSNWLSKLN